jgi:TMEM175 potassium channel family protein
MSAERRRTPTEGPERLEAFSDAVMAVIITILALGLHPPAATTKVAVRAELPTLFIYVLSFLFIAIYWNNHHHLLRVTRFISGAVMWANMLLLFCLSLVPVAAEWLREDKTDPFPVAFFGIVGLAAALAYTWLVRAIIRANGRDSEVALAIRSDFKGTVSLALYAVGVAFAPFSYWVAYACYAAVAVLWLIPDRRFTHEHGAGA